MELKGSLKNFSLPDIVQLIGTTKRSGVLVLGLGPEKASLFFDEGRIVHASFRDVKGQDALNRVFRETEGSFQFLSQVVPPEQTLSMDWMGAIMEAARLHDEGSRDGDLDDLDFEAAVAGPAGGPPPQEDKAQAEVWDSGPVRERMEAILEESFGRKAKKIIKELRKDRGSKLSLLEFCEKAEKYIYVFIDNKRAEEVANRLRSVIEESIL